MKNICMVATTFFEYQILKPLIKEIRKDPSLYLTIISTGKHSAPDMDVSYLRIEEEGYLVHEKTDITFKTRHGCLKTNPAYCEQSEYGSIFKQYKPDMIILTGSRYETLSAAIAASLNDIPVAHIHGGESDFKKWDDSYGYGITKLSHLHFTSTRQYRRQIIQFGEHPDTVFNVGSLLIEKIKSQTFRGRNCFCTDTRLKMTDRFLFVSYQPDTSIGSKNRQVFQEILDTLNSEELKEYKLIFNKPASDGFGRMINQMIDDFTLLHPNRAISSLPNMNLNDFSRTLKYCAALIGNSSKGMILASNFKKPVINIGNRQKGRIRTKNVIDCDPKNEDIILAVQKGVSAHFNKLIKDMHSPYDKGSAAKKIKDTIKAFRLSDMCRKEFYIKES